MSDPTYPASEPHAAGQRPQRPQRQQRQQWQPPRGQAWSAASRSARSEISWSTEAAVALLIATFATVLGGPVGLIWPRVAPHVRLLAAGNGSEAATKSLLGDDLWFALLGALAAVLVTAVLALAARDVAAGPGAMLGLVVGGVLGSLVAAQVGHVLQQPHQVGFLKAHVHGVTEHQISLYLSYFTFKVRMHLALLAWPVAALLLQAAAVGLRGPGPAPPASVSPA